MAQEFKYYVPLLVHGGDGKIGFTFRIVTTDHLINSELGAWHVIKELTKDVLGLDLPEDKNDLPLIPLQWQLIGSTRGPAVKPVKPKGPKH